MLGPKCERSFFVSVDTLGYYDESWIFYPSFFNLDQQNE